MTSLTSLLSIFALISLGWSHGSNSSICTGSCTLTHVSSDYSTSSQPPNTTSPSTAVTTHGTNISAILATSTAVSLIPHSSSHTSFNSSSEESSVPLLSWPLILHSPTGRTESTAVSSIPHSSSHTSFNSSSAQSLAPSLPIFPLPTASTGSLAATTSTTIDPVLATLLTTTSGTTLTQIVIGESISGITLIPAHSGILHSTDPAASSTAILVSGKLKKANEKVKDFENQVKSDPSIGPPVGLLKDTMSFAEGFLKHLTPPSSNSGGCTASLFSLVSCAISDLQTLVGKVKSGIDDIGPLLDHLSELSGELDKENDDKPKTNTPTKSPDTSPTTEATSSKSSDDSSSTSAPPSSSEPPSSSSASPSSSSCGSVSDVDHVTSVCFNTTISTSIFRTCTPHTQTISGCDVTAFTTTTTSSASSIAAAPAMTWFGHPEKPTGTAGYAELAQYILSTLKAMNRLPQIPTTLKTQTTTKVSTFKGSASSKVSKQTKASISPGPSKSSAVAPSTALTTKLSTAKGRTTLPTESGTVSKLPSVTQAGDPSCRLASTTYGPITESGTTYTAGVGEVLTTCTCDNGLSGDTMLLPNPTAASSSILFCQFDSTTYPISTLGPSPTPSAAVEILLEYAKWMDVDEPLYWYVFQFPDSETSTNDPPPLKEACDEMPLLSWRDDTSFWHGETVSDYQKEILENRDFSFPSTELETSTFDIDGHHGCRYQANSDGLWKPGSLSCQQPSGELECQGNDRPKAICPSGNFMVPRVWCPLPV